MTKLTLNMVCVNKTDCRRVPHNMANKRFHWAIKSKWNNSWKEEVLWTIYKNRKKFGKFPIINPKITIELHAVHLMDKDGSYRACKPILDGLVDAGVIIDDSNKYLNPNDYHVTQKKVKHFNEEKVVIIIFA
jgi:hypothetical protein